MAIPKIAHTDPIIQAEVHELLVHLIRSPTVLSIAYSKLDTRCFGREFAGYGFVWDILKTLVGEHGVDVVTSCQFEDRLRHRLVAALDHCEVVGVSDKDEQINMVDELIKEAPERSAEEIDPDYGLDLLKRFLLQRALQGDVLQLAESLKIAPNPDLPIRLQALTDLGTDIQSLAVSKPASIEHEWASHEEQLARFRGRQLVGLKTGIDSLDNRTLGLRGLGALGAGAGVGKTALALNIAIGVCRHHEVNDAVVVFASLEMSRYELYSRVKCNLADLEWSTLIRGSKGHTGAGGPFNVFDQRKLETARQRMQDEQIGSRLTILDREQLGESLSADRLTMILRHAKQQARASRALLIVDYVQILPVPADVSKYTDLEQDRYRVRVLQDVIRKSKSPNDPDGDAVLFISETRKPTRSKDPWANGLAELMGSARLGYAVDYALLYRRMTPEESGNYFGMRSAESLQDEGVAPIMLSLEKGRDGMTRGSWGMTFLFWKSIFNEIEPQPPSDAGVVVPPEEEPEIEFDALFASAMADGPTKRLAQSEEAADDDQDARGRRTAK
jgi:replicative DNA helicase